MKTSLNGVTLIKKFEGFKNYIYLCPAGKETIGYGHAINLKDSNLTKAIIPITKEDANKLLITDLKEVENTINNSVKVDLLQGQFDALASLIYNWGSYNFKASEGLIKLNKNNYQEASYEFFSKNAGVVKVNGIISNGLVARRQAELDLWNES